jgi:hypothetical protein
MSTNTLLRRHILRRGCAVDKYTSIGADGFRQLMSRYIRNRFTFDELDLPADLAARGVDDVGLLPGYFYRDDGLRLWNATATYCSTMLQLFYASDADVIADSELQVSERCGVYTWTTQLAQFAGGNLPPPPPIWEMSKLRDRFNSIVNLLREACR